MNPPFICFYSSHCPCFLKLLLPSRAGVDLQQGFEHSGATSIQTAAYLRISVPSFKDIMVVSLRQNFSTYVILWIVIPPVPSRGLCEFSRFLLRASQNLRPIISTILSFCFPYPINRQDAVIPFQSRCPQLCWCSPS